MASHNLQPGKRRIEFAQMQGITMSQACRIQPISIMVYAACAIDNFILPISIHITH